MIQAVTITPVAIADPPLLNAAGLHAHYALRLILELTTHDGVCGISEIPGGETIHQSLKAFAHRLEGADPFHLNDIKDRIHAFFGKEETTARGDRPWDQRTIVHIFSAIEVACLDIMGKKLDRPVVDLLGGAKRERVPYSAYLFYKYEGAGGKLGFNTDPHASGWDHGRQLEALDADGIVAQAQAMVKEYGFQSIKLKGGVFEPSHELDSIRALHRAFGEKVPLRYDPNAVWSYDTALRYAPEFKPYLEYLEDPVRGQQAMADMRRIVNISLATNMCTTSFEDLPQSVQLHSEDVILCDHHFWGGFRSTMELARICQTFGRGISMHSNNHLGISFAAMTHIGAALPEFEYALDTHYPWQYEEVIEGGRITIEDGMVEVPRGPGLGVEIDRKMLGILHQNYLNCGLTERDDQTAMQVKQPGWIFKPTRW